MKENAITVVIPSIPVRGQLLTRAVRSVARQTLRPYGLAVAIDVDREGAPRTRQRALDTVQTHWVAFLDDDDEFMPQHLDHLLSFALDGGFDYAYSWFRVVLAGGVITDHDPVFPVTHYTTPWDPANPRQTTVTTLVRTDLAKEVGFVSPASDEALIEGQRAGEDWDFTLGCNEKGKIGHLIEKTWLWHHDSGNTSGLPTRW